MPRSWRRAKTAPNTALGEPDARDPAGNRYRGFRIKVRSFDAYRLPIERIVAPESLSEDELLWILSALMREALTRDDEGAASIRLIALARRMSG